jgi:hypothetical protein
MAFGGLEISKLELENAFYSARPQLRIPLPNGEVYVFRFDDTQLLQSAGTVEIRNLSGRSVEDPDCVANIVLTTRSVAAQVFSSQGTYYLNTKAESDGKLVFAVASQSSRAEVGYECLTSAEPVSRPKNLLAAQSVGFANVLRTFRLAPAATAEFTAYHGSKEAAVLEVVTAMSRASAIFQRELGISFELVPGFDGMVYTDPETDPYTTNDPSEQLIHEAQHSFDQVIGTENYDVGIVLIRGTYGLTYFNSVCDPALKGSSCIGLPEPAGDAFHVNLVTHELGHQFGARHTFNSPNGLCTERRDGWTSFEPGAGSTIMSYASLPCEEDSFQPFHDAYFHSENIEQILEFVNSGYASCAQTSPRTNTGPWVNAGPEYFIPARTPFALTASGYDYEGDTIYFNWEQRDLGPAQALSETDDGLGPLFRSIPPSTNATRIFPRLDLVLAGMDAPEERLPTTNRTMQFRAMARDSQNNGGVGWADTQLQVIDTGAPFRVTSHNQTATLTNSFELTWDVAGTTNAPISATNVVITLSTNGGATFDLVLASSVANDGVQEIELPHLTIRTNLRIKVQAIGNIFFDINDADLSVDESYQPPDTVPLSAIQTEDGSFRISWNSKPGIVYRLEQSSALVANNWLEVFQTNATQNSVQIDLPKNGEHSFYRVVRP